MTGEDSGLFLRDIISYITMTYPFYKMADPVWQNSIKSNLSLHEGFENLPGSAENRQAGKSGNRWRIRKGYEEQLLKRRK